jgi:tRNA1Val (adenine37-N6)-methyltransferase
MLELKENERIDDLEYKGLKIIQNKDGFCFGVDSVLLSDYAKNIKKNSKVIDIGTGTGIIGLLLCKKTNLKKIYGIEIQEEVADMATRSVKLNKLEDKFEIINTNIKNVFETLNKYEYDVVVTNPPYKKENTGVTSIEKKQLISRHEIECTLEDIISISYRLLKDKGEFYMVHRAERLVDIMYYLRKYRLEPKNIRLVQPKENKEPNLILIKAKKNGGQGLKFDRPLIVYNEDGTYTEEILKIYNKI